MINKNLKKTMIINKTTKLYCNLHKKCKLLLDPAFAILNTRFKVILTYIKEKLHNKVTITIVNVSALCFAVLAGLLALAFCLYLLDKMTGVFTYILEIIKFLNSPNKGVTYVTHPRGGSFSYTLAQSSSANISDSMPLKTHAGWIARNVYGSFTPSPIVWPSLLHLSWPSFSSFPSESPISDVPDLVETKSISSLTSVWEDRFKPNSIDIRIEMFNQITRCVLSSMRRLSWFSPDEILHTEEGRQAYANYILQWSDARQFTSYHCLVLQRKRVPAEEHMIYGHALDLLKNTTGFMQLNDRRGAMNWIQALTDGYNSLELYDVE